ncbi:MAG: hypothetical protein ACRYFB_15735 [Janthinobacterium lividum]
MKNQVVRFFIGKNSIGPTAYQCSSPCKSIVPPHLAIGKPASFR